MRRACLAGKHVAWAQGPGGAIMQDPSGRWLAVATYVTESVVHVVVVAFDEASVFQGIRACSTPSPPERTAAGEAALAAALAEAGLVAGKWYTSEPGGDEYEEATASQVRQLSAALARPDDSGLLAVRPWRRVAREGLGGEGYPPVRCEEVLAECVVADAVESVKGSTLVGLYSRHSHVALDAEFRRSQPAIIALLQPYKYDACLPSVRRPGQPPRDGEQFAIDTSCLYDLCAFVNDARDGGKPNCCFRQFYRLPPEGSAASAELHVAVFTLKGQAGVVRRGCPLLIDYGDAYRADEADNAGVWQPLDAHCCRAAMERVGRWLLLNGRGCAPSRPPLDLSSPGARLVLAARSPEATLVLDSGVQALRAELGGPLTAADLARVREVRCSPLSLAPRDLLGALPLAPSLVTLVLDHSDFADLAPLAMASAALPALPSLRTLSMRGMALRDLGPLAQACPGLAHLDISGCARVTSLPALARLELLEASGCSKVHWDDDLRRCTALRRLRLAPSPNNLLFAPSWECLSALPALEALAFRGMGPLPSDAPCASDDPLVLLCPTRNEYLPLPPDGADGQHVQRILCAVERSGLAEHCHVTSAATLADCTLLGWDERGRRWRFRDGGCAPSPAERSTLDGAVAVVDLGLQLAAGSIEQVLGEYSDEDEQDEQDMREYDKDALFGAHDDHECSRVSSGIGGLLFEVPGRDALRASHIREAWALLRVANCISKLVSEGKGCGKWLQRIRVDLGCIIDAWTQAGGPPMPPDASRPPPCAD